MTFPNHKADEFPSPLVVASTGSIPFKRPRSRIANDPELMAFIAQRAANTTQTEILAACRQQFGTDRSPSMSGLNRFIHSLAKPG